MLCVWGWVWGLDACGGEDHADMAVFSGVETDRFCPVSPLLGEVVLQALTRERRLELVEFRARVGDALDNGSDYPSYSPRAPRVRLCRSVCARGFASWDPGCSQAGRRSAADRLRRRLYAPRYGAAPGAGRAPTAAAPSATVTARRRSLGAMTSLRHFFSDSRPDFRLPDSGTASPPAAVSPSAMIGPPCRRRERRPVARISGQWLCDRPPNVAAVSSGGYRVDRRAIALGNRRPYIGGDMAYSPLYSAFVQHLAPPIFRKISRCDCLGVDRRRH